MPYGGGDYVDITLPAAADLSGHQYKFVIVDANGRGTVLTACTTVPLGILQNKPGTADVGARIRVSGVSKLRFGAATNEGAELASGPEGFGTATTTSGDGVGAICLHSVGGSADINDVLIARYRY